MNQTKLNIACQVVTKITTIVTLEQPQYDAILRKAVGAPDDGEVRITNEHGGDILITWTTTEYDDETGE